SIRVLPRDQGSSRHGPIRRRACRTPPTGCWVRPPTAPTPATPPTRRALATGTHGPATPRQRARTRHHREGARSATPSYRLAVNGGALRELPDSTVRVPVSDRHLRILSGQQDRPAKLVHNLVEHAACQPHLPAPVRCGLLMQAPHE